VFNGPPPTIHSLKSESEESTFVGNWIAERAKAGLLPHEFDVFVRSAAQLDRARAAVKEAAGTAARTNRGLDQSANPKAGNPSLNSNTGCLKVVDTCRPL
jgi:hypothetical protein